MTERNKMDFAAECKARKITQMQACQILHVSQSSISRWIRGIPMPPAMQKLWRLHWKEVEEEQTLAAKRHEQYLKSKKKVAE